MTSASNEVLEKELFNVKIVKSATIHSGKQFENINIHTPASVLAIRALSVEPSEHFILIIGSDI